MRRLRVVCLCQGRIQGGSDLPNLPFNSCEIFEGFHQDRRGVGVGPLDPGSAPTSRHVSTRFLRCRIRAVLWASFLPPTRDVLIASPLQARLSRDVCVHNPNPVVLQIHVAKVDASRVVTCACEWALHHRCFFVSCLWTKRVMRSGRNWPGTDSCLPAQDRYKGQRMGAAPVRPSVQTTADSRCLVVYHTRTTVLIRVRNLVEALTQGSLLSSPVLSTVDPPQNNSLLKMLSANAQHFGLFKKQNASQTPKIQDPSQL